MLSLSLLIKDRNWHTRSCLYLSLWMIDIIEIEPYEEIVDRDEVYSTPSGSRSASPVSVNRSLPPAQSLSQGPSTSVYNANLMTSVMRPDPRYELALIWHRKWRILRQSTPTRRRWQLHNFWSTAWLNCRRSFAHFYRASARAKHTDARYWYSKSVRLSVRPSVTFRYQTAEDTAIVTIEDE